MRRVPPVLLALGLTVVLLVLLVGGYALFGPKGATARCTAAQQAGPYGCVDFVSVSGTENGSPVDALAGGGLVYRVLKSGTGYRIVVVTGCNGLAGAIGLTATRYRVTDVAMNQALCRDDAANARDTFAAALFDGTVRVDDRGDATVVLTTGARSAVFAQTVIPKA